MGAPAVINLQAYQGDRFEVTLRIRDRAWNEEFGDFIPGDYINLTGYTAKGHVKVSKDIPDFVAAFTFDFADQEDQPGMLTAYLLPEQTAKFSGPEYQYDIQLWDDTERVTTYLAGTIKVDQEVTRGV